MPVSKKYLKSKPICKVTFKLPKEASDGAEDASLVGDFNDWDKTAAPMKKLKTGGFTVTLDLEVGKEYHYRFLVDNEKWENDWEADKYAYSPYASADNSVVVV